MAAQLMKRRNGGNACAAKSASVTGGGEAASMTQWHPASKPAQSAKSISVSWLAAKMA
jgi:hypothetical protein